MVTGTVNPSVLNSALGDLVLRIRGSNCNGQILRLKSAKCTIGSGPNCTLRLRAQGVEPLACLILRGPNGALIRRWSPKTRLNGQTFTDALLSAGDRLSIGSLDFDIVATSEIETESPADPAFDTDERDKQLEEAAKVLQAERDEFEAERLHTDQREKQFEEAAKALQAERVKFEAERLHTDERDKQLEEAAKALQAERDEFEAECRRWENLRSTSLTEESQQQTAIEEQLAQVKAQWEELELQRQSWNSKQKQLQDEQDAAKQQVHDRERQLNDREAKLNALAAEFETRQLQLEVQNAALEFRGKEIADQAAELAGQSSKNNAYAKELDARNSQLDLQTGQLQSQAVELNRRSAQIDVQTEDINRRSAALDAQLAELKNQTAELKKQSDELKAQSADLQTRDAVLNNQTEELKKASAELNAQSADLQTCKAELDSKQSELETERRKWEEARRTEEMALALREKETIQKTAHLESIQEQLGAQQEQLDRRLAEFNRDREEWNEERSKGESLIEVSKTIGQSPSANDAIQSKPENTPSEIDDILHLFGRDAHTSLRDSPTDEPVARSTSQQVNAGKPAGDSSAEHSSKHAEEESVDDYMVRLMKRIRSTQGELPNTTDKTSAPAPNKAETAQLPFESELSLSASSEQGMEQSLDPGGLLPRTVAPEKHADITLFRDLANYSAQTALGTHARSQMIRIMYTKLAVALIGGFTGLFLLLLWQTWFKSSLTLFSAVMSFVIAVIWGVQYVLLTMQLLVHGSDDPEPTPSSRPKNDSQATASGYNATCPIDGNENASDAKPTDQAIDKTPLIDENNAGK